MSNLFDTSNAPTTEPVEVIAGDYLAFKRTDLAADYPVASYTLTYIAREKDGRKITWTSADDGNGDHLVEASSSTTSDYTAGQYWFDAFIVRNSDSERIKIGSGTFTVVDNKSTESTDPRSHNQVMVDAIKAALENRATHEQLDVLSYSMTDVSADRRPQVLLEMLVQYEARLRAENRRKRARSGKTSGNKIKASF